MLILLDLDNFLAKPMIAVACDVSVYLYQNTRPSYKFILPARYAVKQEVEIWKQIDLSSENAINEIHARLESLQE